MDRVGKGGPEDKSLQAGRSETTEANVCSLGGWAPVPGASRSGSGECARPGCRGLSPWVLTRDSAWAFRQTNVRASPPSTCTAGLHGGLFPVYLPPTWVPAPETAEHPAWRRRPQGPRPLARQGLQRRGWTKGARSPWPPLCSSLRLDGQASPGPGSLRSLCVAAWQALQGSSASRWGGPGRGTRRSSLLGETQSPAYLWQRGHLPFIF